MRKVLGAKKAQLVYQFLSESLLFTVISFTIAIALAGALLPTFNLLLGKSIPFAILGSKWLLISMFSFSLLITALSGLYPAMFMSSLSPDKAIRGTVLKSTAGLTFQNFLVVGQFSASIVLAIGSLVIYEQLQYIRQKDLGYNREQVVYIPYDTEGLSDKHSLIRAELMKNPNVERVSLATEMPLDMGSQGIVDKWEGNDDKRNLFIYRNYVDYDFIDLFEIELVEGRNFSPDVRTDSTDSYVLNQSAVKALGWQSAVGKQFQDGYVIGVVKDFHFQRFDLNIQPLFLRLRSKANSGPGNIAVKIKMDDPDETIAEIEKAIKVFSPHTPFECRFLGNDYEQLYRSETRFGQTFNVFTIIALSIACMGLFGLVSHHVIQRTKEIGIRKVLGATTESIVSLVSRKFLFMVVIAVTIASPIAWWTMDKWLEEFVYKINLEAWMFIVCGLAAVSLALITISFQSIKAALMNPVKSLRSE